MLLVAWERYVDNIQVRVLGFPALILCPPQMEFLGLN